MGLVRYRPRHKQAVFADSDHPSNQYYKQPNQAWAALRRYYNGREKEVLRREGWKVKMDIDESELAEEVAEVALDQAPIPAPARSLLGGLLGKLFRRKG